MKSQKNFHIKDYKSEYIEYLKANSIVFSDFYDSDFNLKSELFEDDRGEGVIVKYYDSETDSEVEVVEENESENEQKVNYIINFEQRFLERYWKDYCKFIEANLGKLFFRLFNDDFNRMLHFVFNYVNLSTNILHKNHYSKIDRLIADIKEEFLQHKNEYIELSVKVSDVDYYVRYLFLLILRKRQDLNKHESLIDQLFVYDENFECWRVKDK